MAIDLLVTDKALNFLGDPLDGWTEFSCDLRFNEPASGQVTLPARPLAEALLQGGNRLVVMRDGAIWCAGPMEIPQGFDWSVESNPGVGEVTCNFSDDLARVAGYLTYPNPALTFSSQTTTSDDSYQLTSTNAETVIRTLVNLNCGPGAIASRRIEQLVLDTVAAVGSTTSITTRFEPLLDACRTAASGDGLGFRTRQVGTEIRFGVYQPADRTATARFSEDFGNLRVDSFTLSAPAATSELVLGGDEGARQYVEVSSGAHADWYRVEKFIDQAGTTDANGELTQAGQQALGEDGPQASLATETVDTDDLKAGVDYGLGDLVSVVLPTGYVITDVVRSIRLEATPDGGELVTSVIGTQDATTELRLVRQIRELARRLGRIETRR